MPVNERFIWTYSIAVRGSSGREVGYGCVLVFVMLVGLLLLCYLFRLVLVLWFYVLVFGCCLFLGGFVLLLVWFCVYEYGRGGLVGWDCC